MRRGRGGPARGPSRPVTGRDGNSPPRATVSITFYCDQCGQCYQVGENLAGKRVKCKKCGGLVSVPAPEALAPAPAPERIPEPRPAPSSSAAPGPRPKPASAPTLPPPPPSPRPGPPQAPPSVDDLYGLEAGAPADH